jgi:hypothetical protein
MHCCKKLFSVLLRGMLLAWLFAAAAHAEDITVNKAELRVGEDGYHLYATYDINLNFVVQQALSRGIPLYFVGEFSLTRSRWYWLDEEIYKGSQTIKFSYNVLTRQYRISRGALFQNFDSFEDALNILARQSSAPIPAELIRKDEGFISELIKKDGNYIAAVRLRLDTSQLPKLLQVNALTSKDWELDSGWYRWVVRPADGSGRGENRTE